MIISALLKPLEKILNRYLAADPEKAAPIKKLNGKVIQINLIPLQFTCYLTIENNHLILSKQSAQTANTIISGSPLALLQTLQQKGTTLPEGVTITGDLLLIQSLSNIFRDIDVDWEEALSKYIGDFAAHGVCQWWQKLTNYKNTATKSILRSTTEYLQEELQCFPTRIEIESFYHEVDVMRNDVDRLEAKINLLTQS